MLQLLLVEDELFAAKAVARLVQASFVLDVRPTVLQALQALEQRRFHAAIIDITLPDGSGVDVLSAFRDRNLSAQALVLTVHHDPEIINRVGQLHAEYACKAGTMEPVQDFARRVIFAHHLKDERLRAHAATFAQRQRLTLRQSEILALALSDRERADFSSALGITDATVKTLVRQLLSRCDAERLRDVVEDLHDAVAHERGTSEP